MFSLNTALLLDCQWVIDHTVLLRLVLLRICSHESKGHSSTSAIDRLKSPRSTLFFCPLVHNGWILKVAQQNACQSELTAEGHGRTLPRASQPLKRGVLTESQLSMESRSPRGFYRSCKTLKMYKRPYMTGSWTTATSQRVTGFFISQAN